MNKLIHILLAVLLISCVTLTAANSGPDMSKYNTRIGDKHLAENGDLPDVTTTSTGLQYRIIQHGTGTQHPSKRDTVIVHYRGTLLNGKEFDSSYKRGEPAQFGVTQVIAGWTEALQCMCSETYCV